MKTTRTSDDRFRNSGAEHETKELSRERPRSRDTEERERSYAVVDREPGRTDDDEMFRPFDL